MENLRAEVEEIIQKILNHPRFLLLKEVVENNAYHDHEDVYSHSVRTLEKAKEVIDGRFISNPDSREMFLVYVNQKLGDLKRSDLMMLIAPLHDIGKTKGGLVIQEDGTTLCPGHELKGSQIVQEVVGEMGFSEEQIGLIKKVIKLHDIYNERNLKEGLTIEQIKQFGEGVRIEILFNRYCDCFYAKPFQPSLKIIERLFSDKELYR